MTKGFSCGIFEVIKMSIIKTAIPKKEVTPVAPVVALPEVVALIKSAVKASSSMLAKCKQAAKEASGQLDTALPLKERIDAVVLAYSVAISGEANVKANFKDALTLVACAQAPVTFENRKGEEVHTTAADAIELSRHDMKLAAKAVRSDNGFGRKTAERSPKTPTAGPVNSVNRDESVMRIVASNLFAADDAFIKALVKTCADNGWTLAPTVGKLPKVKLPKVK